MNKLFYTIALLLAASIIFTSCRNDDDNDLLDPSVTDEGVVIGSIDGNPIRWATRNVAAPGTFAANPEDAGMFFQWNRRTGISAITPGAGVEIPNWDTSQAEGTTWARANDPCPQGWRVPTMAELNALRATGSAWTNRNGVYGVYFGIRTGQNRIFLPASGWRSSDRGDSGALLYVGVYGFFWSSTEGGSESAQFLWLDDGGTSTLWGWRSNGISVRCVAE